MQLANRDDAHIAAIRRARAILEQEDFGSAKLGEFYDLLHRTVATIVATAKEAIEFTDIIRDVARAAGQCMPTKGLTTAAGNELGFMDAIKFQRSMNAAAAAIDNRPADLPPCLANARKLSEDEQGRVTELVLGAYDRLTGPCTPVKQTSLLQSPPTVGSQLSQRETPIIPTSNPALAVRGNVVPVPFNLGNAGGGFGQEDGPSSKLPAPAAADLTSPATVPPARPMPPAPSRSLHDQVPLQNPGGPTVTDPNFTVTMTGKPKHGLLLAAQKSRCALQRSKEQMVPFKESIPTMSPEKPNPLDGLSPEQIRDNHDFGVPLTWITAASAMPRDMVEACHQEQDVLDLINDSDPQSSMWLANNYIFCEHPKHWTPAGCLCLFPRCDKCKRLMPGQPTNKESPNALEIFFSCVFRPWKHYDTNFYGRKRDCKSSGGYVMGARWVRETIAKLKAEHGEFSQPIYAFVQTEWVQKVVQHTIMARTYRDYKRKNAEKDAKMWSGDGAATMTASLAKQGINLADIAAVMGPPQPSTSASSGFPASKRHRSE